MIFSWKLPVMVLIWGATALSSFYFHSQYIKEKNVPVKPQPERLQRFP